MRTWRLAAALTVVVTLVTATAGVAAASGGRGHRGGRWNHNTYTCDGSTGTAPLTAIPPGTYGNVVVTGNCSMPLGLVVIKGNLYVNAGSLLDAVTPGDPVAGTQDVPATVLIGGNVMVGSGAVLLLGCSPNISCAPPTPPSTTNTNFGISFDTVHGSIEAFGAQAVVLHSVAIGGDVDLHGGGGGTAAEACNGQAAGSPIDTSIVPWSEDAAFDFVPVYSDFEDLTIGGNLQVSGLTSCWLGAIRNFVAGDAIFANNTFGDPDASELLNSVVGRDLGCWNDSPAPQFGDSSAAPNLVGGKAYGQCGFNVVLPNPAPEAIASEMLSGVGVNEHLAVPICSLHTYHGLRTSTLVSSVPTYPVKTSDGSEIFAELNDFTLSGNGITGTADYTGGAPGQSPGDAVLGTQYPNGWSQFIAYDGCGSCTFHGQTGSLSLRAYGTTTPGGVTSGYFLITSGGAVLSTPTSPAPGLATLVGFGTFWGNGSGPLHLVEHLGFG